jgi:hypothetical protein
VIPPLVHTFDRLDDAQAAREALLAAGFAADRMQITALQDEAGPQQGNFISGNGRDKEEHFVGDYAQNFADAQYRSSQLLTVGLVAEDERHRAAEVLASHGGIDLERRTGGATRAP